MIVLGTKRFQIMQEGSNEWFSGQKASETILGSFWLSGQKKKKKYFRCMTITISNI